MWHKGEVEAGPDLNSASRETLLSIIAELRREIAQLKAQLAGRGGPRGMPGNKPGSGRKPVGEKRPRRPRSRGFARRRMEPTRRVIHALESCPECGTGLAGGWAQRTREIIEIPVVPAEVTEHVFVARMCALCRRRRLPHDALRGLAVGRQRIGVNLASLIVTLREECRLPIRSVQRYLQTVHQLRLSVGAIVEAVHRAAQQAQPAVNAMLERIRGSPAVNADETGWREDGVNGYVWTFATPTERYFVRRGRGKTVVDEVLGESFNGVLVSDFYAAYNHYPGLKQRCWVHLLRDIHDLRELYPEDAALARWAGEVRRLYAKAKACANAGGLPPAQGQSVLEERLLSLCRPYLDDPLAPQSRLCRRIERFINELFVFVSHPEAPPENNAAERSLRHLVVSRKISGGTRSERGTNSKMTLASVFGAWRAKGLNPLSESRKLLTSPQL